MVFVLSTLDMIKAVIICERYVFCSENIFGRCTALHDTTPPVFHRASSWPITQMRAVETLENEDEVIFLLDLKDGGFRVVLSSLRRTTE